MFFKRLHEYIRRSIEALEGYIDRPWYLFLIGALAALDYFIVVIPTDGIIVSSAMLRPKRWFGVGLSVAIGSTVGAMLIALLVQHYGLSLILNFYPNFQETSTWIYTLKFFESYGLYLVFLVAASPFAQHPAVILAVLAHSPFLTLTAIIFSGRALKAILLTYLASHAPKLVTRVWGIKTELKDVGVKVE